LPLNKTKTMKKLFTLMVVAFVCTGTKAQTTTTTDTTVISVQINDTIRIGNIIIIKKASEHSEGSGNSKTVINIIKQQQHRSGNVTTNWGIIDFGFTNYYDKTNYAEASANQTLVNAPGTGYPLGASDFKLNAAKSVDINIWFFMQELNLVKHYINLKYGLGLELNNYRFSSNISFKQPGFSPYNSTTAVPNAYVIRDDVNFSKNKLAADYVTVPLMLNFTTNSSNLNKDFIFSVGISAGYLYSERNKQVSNERGKLKNKGNYDMQQFKFSYIAEIGLGPIKLYGSYTPKSIFKNSLDLRPYSIGIRLSH